MCSPLAAPRWVGGSGARAQGPFAPGGQWITLPVIRVEALQHHDWRYRERGLGEREPGAPAQPPGRSPHSRDNARNQRHAPHERRPGLRVEPAMTPLGPAMTPLGPAMTPLGPATTPLGPAMTPVGPQ